MSRGKLIVIEGSDASGKTTQIKLLIEHLKKNKISFASFDFPQYKKTFFGDFAGRFLNGEFGHFSRINPYLAMFPYAGDRWQAKKSLENSLQTKKIVICNRYATSISYQLAKIAPKKREDFIAWSETLEYKIFGIPRESLVIFLYVPLEISQKLLESRGKKSYLNGKTKDHYEKDLEYLKKVDSSYNYILNKKRHWLKISCIKDGQLLTPDQIHAKIIEVLKSFKIL